jgi:hypothetical protein
VQLRVLHHVFCGDLEIENARASIEKVVEVESAFGVAHIRHAGAAFFVAARCIYSSRIGVEGGQWASALDLCASDLCASVVVTRRTRCPAVGDHRGILALQPCRHQISARVSGIRACSIGNVGSCDIVKDVIGALAMRLHVFHFR